MGRINQLTPTTIVTTDSVIAVDAANGGVTNKLTINTLAGGLRVIGNYATQAQLAAKQDVLTFDDAPEEDSDNPVTSGGIYNAIGSAMSNVYTKSETDAAIQQSTAPSVNAVAPYGQWTSYTGGYYLVGKIVFVQVTAVAGNFGANDYFTMISSLPSPAYPTALAITTTSDNLKGAEAYVDTTGKLLVKSGGIALTGQRVVVTGCYIKQ